MKTLCIDLDATLAEYHGWTSVDDIGKPLPGAKEFVNGLRDMGFRIVIFTSRLNSQVNGPEAQTKGYKAVVNWFIDNGIHFDKIYTGEGKPMAEAYIDDRAVSVRPQEDKDAYSKALPQILKLSNVKSKKEVSPATT